MAAEVERKLLVPAIPDPVRVGHGVRLRQGYSAIDRAVEARIGLTDDGRASERAKRSILVASTDHS